MSNLTINSLENFIEDSKTVTDFTINGNCSQCGGCCTNFIPISNVEILRIRNYIHKYNIKEQKTLIPTINPSFDMTCPFLSRETKKCLIYEVRPLICRRFKCNQPMDIIQEQKDALINRYGMTDLREEFYKI